MCSFVTQHNATEVLREHGIGMLLPDNLIFISLPFSASNIDFFTCGIVWGQPPGQLMKLRSISVCNKVLLWGKTHLDWLGLTPQWVGLCLPRPTHGSAPAQLCEIHSLGPNLFVSIDWVPYMTVTYMTVFLFSIHLFSRLLSGIHLFSNCVMLSHLVSSPVFEVLPQTVCAVPIEKELLD